MSKVANLIGQLKKGWAQPREAIHRGGKCPFLLACSFSPESTYDVRGMPVNVPPDVQEFWKTAQNAALFKDVKYGQWGIEILDPKEALAETSRQTTRRPKDFTSADLVLARFFGDSDLLVIGCDRTQPNF